MNIKRLQSSIVENLLILSLIFLIIDNSNIIFSQITITDPKITIEEQFTVPLKPDTTKPITHQYHLPDFKQYIGLELYLPPDYKTEGYTKLRPTLVNTSLKAINVNPNERIVYKSYKYTRDSYGYNQITLETDSIEYKKIITFMYNSAHIETKYIMDSNDNLNRSVVTLNHSPDTYDNYYTLIDVLYGQRLKDTLIKMDKELDEARKYFGYYRKESNFKEFDPESNFFLESSSWYKIRDKDYLFLLQDKKGDFLYSTHINIDFVSVPYYNNQVALLKGKEIISDPPKYSSEVKGYKSGITKIVEDDKGNKVEKDMWTRIRKGEVWYCEDVTLTKPEYELTYILKKGEQRALVPDEDIKRFKLLSVYNEEKALSQQNADIVKKRQLEAQKKEDELKEKKEREFLSLAISKYGKDIGSIVGKHKVQIGMNKEMCSDAWGKPFYINESTTINGTDEVWYYSYGNTLSFKNGILFMINQLK